jgi:hemerythrin-like domain-containing protein
MPDAILMLRLEHRRIHSVLDILAGELHALDDEEAPSFRLLEGALLYLSDFSDECHHPKEDLIYRKLAAASRRSVGPLIGLEREHEDLARLTRRALETVREARLDSKRPLAPIADALRELLDHYRRHMAGEEKHLFATALRRLAEDDWTAIDFDLFDRPDPAFDHRTEERFAELYERLTEAAREQQRFTEKAKHILLSEEEATWLRELTSIAEFNARQTQSGGGARLIRFAGGGYGLLAAGEQLLTDIPECSEQRAAWCAYYFLRGQSERTASPAQ